MEILGVIGKGKSYGRKLGYPTANISLTDRTEPGIYVARAWLSAKEYMAAVFIEESGKLLEAHLLDFSEDAYGKELRVELLKKLRDSKRFDSEESLKNAIEGDITAVRSHFKTV
jgi:riboflavin kinase / FMN adenylyltransferase